MILYYALGGGLGHVVRAAKMARQLGGPNLFVVVTANASAEKLFPATSIEKVADALRHDPLALNTLVLALIAKYHCDEFWVDTFPFGILGELDIHAIAERVKTVYVARYMNWPAYAPKIKPLGLFAATLVVDDLHPEQKAFINARSETHCAIDLSGENLWGEKLCPDNHPSEIPVKRAFPGYWLIMHSGNLDELRELKAYADDVAEAECIRPQFVVASQCVPDFDVDYFLSGIPCGVDLESVARIFTGCGYNSMQELKAYSDKHHFLPFERKYDDQFLRAKKAKEARG